MKAIFKLFSLTPEQRRFMWNKQVVGARPAGDWLAFFRPLVAFESDLGKAGFLFAFVALLAGLLLFSGVVTLFSRGGLGSGMVMLLLGLAGAAFAIGFRLRLPGRHLKSGLNPLLAVLREDMKAADPVTLTVDLRGAVCAANKSGQRDLPAKGTCTKIVETSYAENWLEGDATLADGTRLVWKLTDYVRHEKRTKRSSSGKTKWKTKYRVATHVRLAVGWRKDCFARRGPPGEGGVDVTDDGRRLWMKVRRTFRHTPLDTFNAADFVQTVATAYARVEPAGGAA